MPQVTMTAREVNFDALVGPTHHYAGLAHGNIASARHGGRVSNPKAAALEGLAKMKALMDLGLTQAVLPPRDRPNLRALRAWGFEGDAATVLDRAHREAPVLLAAASSASSMWAANAATVSPSADTADGRLHLTPANLLSHPHRAIEALETGAILRAIFPDDTRFAHHPALIGGRAFADEGAANHTRLCGKHHEKGVEMFVFGRSALGAAGAVPRRFPARHTLEASQAIARRHGLDPQATVFAQQHPDAIDAGVFHNDVIAVGHRNVLLCHERAWVDQPTVLNTLRSAFEAVCGHTLRVIEIPENELSLADAVGSYLFNSQLISPPELPPESPDGAMALIYPSDCDDYPAVRAVIEALVAGDNPIREARAVRVRQSMCNGGGPACLRLRIVMTDRELSVMRPGVLLTPALHDRLVDWVNRHYREALSPDDLRDPMLVDESQAALDELTGMLGLPGLYAFER